MAIHLSTDEKKYFSDYCKDLATLDPTGDMAGDLKRVDALRKVRFNILRESGFSR